MRKLGLLLALAAPSWGGPVPVQVPVQGPVQAPVLVPSFPAETPVHPLLLGSLSDPDSPISKNLAFQLNELAGLSPSGREAAARYVDALARQEPRHRGPVADAARKAAELKGLSRIGMESMNAYLEDLSKREPLDRVTAGVIARMATQPDATLRIFGGAASHPDSPSAGPGEGTSPLVQRLAERARNDPAVSYLFDGESSKPSLEMDGIENRGGKLFFEGQRLKPLGRGAFGVVYAHPRIEGAVIKMVDLSFDAFMASGSGGPREVAKHDAEVTEHLARAGVGPRLLGTGDLDIKKRKGRLVYPMMVKERVYGTTVQDLIWQRKYSPVVHQILHRTLDSMAAGRVRVRDMNPANFMIGRTLVGPEIRGLHIDGGMKDEVAPEETPQTLRRSYESQAALTKWRVDRNVGMIETTLPLSYFLDDGLTRYQAKSFWERFWLGLKDAFLNSNLPGK